MKMKDRERDSCAERTERENQKVSKIGRQTHTKVKDSDKHSYIG